MRVFQQLATGWVGPAQGITKIRAPAALSLGIYTLAAGVVFALFSWALISHEDTIKQGLFDYLLPTSWHGISDKLIQFFFESQTKLVLAGLIINGSIVVASICLFPIKEWCSQRYEQSLALHHGTYKEFPLWMQAIEEGKLLALYVAAQSVILGIGYYPYAWSSALSSILSMAFLFYSFGLDFISPAFQRRRIHYTRIVKLLSKNSLLTFSFGALFSLPVVLLSHFLLSAENVDLTNVTVILFFVNILFFTLAIPAGTFLANKLLPDLERTPDLTNASKRWTYGSLAVILTVGLSFHFMVASSMHHKSQLLKCDYQIDWSSFNTKLPGLGNLLSGKESLRLSFMLNINNPTAFDLDIENSKITFWHKGKEVSQTQIKAFAVGAGQNLDIPMDIEIGLNADNVSFFGGFSEGWSAQMELELLPGIPFVIQLI